PEAERRVSSAVQKRAQEVARYVLPLGTPAHLYHTINGLTLLRYYVLANQLDVPTEVRYIVNQMVAEVLEVDPYFLGAPGYPLDLSILGMPDTLEYEMMSNLETSITISPDETFFEEFDAQLNGLDSRLVSYDPDSERLLAVAVRTV